MKLLTTIILMVSAYAHAQTDVNNVGNINFADIGGVHFIQTVNADDLTMQSAQGLNLVAGSSVFVTAGGDGPMVLSTSNTSDIDLNAGGSVVVATGSGYPLYVFAESIQAYTDHGLQLSQTGAQPTCDSTRRGTIWYEASGTGVADILQLCAKTAGDTYAWRSL